MPPSAKMKCEQCDTWIPVESKTEHVQCECGAIFAVTITEISVQSV